MHLIDQARKRMALAALQIWRARDGQDVTSPMLEASMAYELAAGRHAGYLAPFPLSSSILAVFEQPTADGVTVVLYHNGEYLDRCEVARLGGGMGPLGDARRYADLWQHLVDLGAEYRGAHKDPSLIARVKQGQREVEAILRGHVRFFADEFDGMSRAEQGIRTWRRRGERHIGPLVRALTE